MIATLTMELEVPEGVFFSFQKSSLLQGVLMEHISPEYALKLHENGLKPYSQSVIVKKGKTFWQINIWTCWKLMICICSRRRDFINAFLAN